MVLTLSIALPLCEPSVVVSPEPIVPGLYWSRIRVLHSYLGRLSFDLLLNVYLSLVQSASSSCLSACLFNLGRILADPLLLVLKHIQI